MKEVKKDELKKYFTTGAKPTEQEFATLIDSLAHVSDVKDLGLAKASEEEAITAATAIDTDTDTDTTVTKTATDTSYMTPRLTRLVISTLMASRYLPEVDDKITAAIDTLMKNDDADNVIDTLKEVFDFVKSLPEGEEQLMALLNAKVNKTDIADNLTTDDPTKVLSAKQGKALQDGKVNKADTMLYQEKTSRVRTLESDSFKNYTETGFYKVEVQGFSGSNKSGMLVVNRMDNLIFHHLYDFRFNCYTRAGQILDNGEWFFYNWTKLFLQSIDLLSNQNVFHENNIVKLEVDFDQLDSNTSLKNRRTGFVQIKVDGIVSLLHTYLIGVDDGHSTSSDPTNIYQLLYTGSKLLTRQKIGNDWSLWHNISGDGKVAKSDITHQIFNYDYNKVLSGGGAALISDMVIKPAYNAIFGRASNYAQNFYLSPLGGGGIHTININKDQNLFWWQSVETLYKVQNVSDKEQIVRLSFSNFTDVDMADGTQFVTRDNRGSGYLPAPNGFLVMLPYETITFIVHNVNGDSETIRVQILYSKQHYCKFDVDNFGYIISIPEGRGTPKMTTDHVGSGEGSHTYVFRIDQAKKTKTLNVHNTGNNVFQTLIENVGIPKETNICIVDFYSNPAPYFRVYCEFD